MAKQDIFDYLKTIGCCDVCCLRYFNGRGDDYLNVHKALEMKDIKVEVSDDEAAKRSKPNVCIACLDIFSERVQSEALQGIVNHPDLGQYQCETVLSSFSIPIMLSLRGLSIWIALIRRFPGHFSLTEPPDVPLKEIVKVLVNPKLCSLLGKSFEQAQNGLMFNVFFEHEQDEAELLKLYDVKPKLFKNRSMAPRKFHNEFLTRNAFDRNFTPDKIDMDLFAQNVPVPSEVPAQPIRLERITLQGPTIFVAGRYRKMSRMLCQSPWVLQGKRIMEECVSELIVDQVAPFFGVPAESVVFSSSGREDVDVRCLGNGRPFALEIADSRKMTLPRDVAGKMETAVDKSGKVSIMHLQIVSRDDMKNIKTGEEDKKKIYRALCIVKDPVTVEVMERLNMPEGFTIDQLTPLRVLHRRPLLKRPRRIFSVTAHVHKDNHRMIVLDIVTQAGTYIKELVHGEFGRTSPSICSTIGQWIDIVALDVMAVVLDWPEAVDNKQINAADHNNEHDSPIKDSSE